MLLKAFLMSLGMFSVFPVPKNSWNDACARLVIPMLPAVGGVIGLCWYAAALGLNSLGIPTLLESAVVLLIPFVLSGFLHVDGYMDTADAIFSRRTLEERRRILKDPHSGSFAVVAAICLFLLQFCAVHTIVSRSGVTPAFVLIPIASRSAAALAALCLTPITDGYMSTFKANMKPSYIIAAAVCAAACLALAYPVGAVLPLAVILLSAAATAAYTHKQLQGFSGDLCGCVIIVAELAGLLCLAVL